MLIFPDKIRSNNTLDYGIVDMIQISGSRTVQFTEDLFNISDAILSSNGTGDDAIGQCWFVSDDNKKYYLTNWNLRKTYSGWTSELLYSLGVGSEQAFQGSRGLELENKFNNLLTTFNGLSGLTYLTYIFNYDQISTTLNVSSNLNVSGVISGSSYYNLPIASYNTKGISSFNSNFFTVNNGVVSINPDIIGGGSGLDEAQLQTYLESHGYVTSTYVNNRISSLVSSAPEALNTLNELALALGNDPNFATTVTNLISSKWTQDNTKIVNWDLAYTNTHTHNNKSSLDLITSSGITNWNTAYSNSHTHSNKSDLDTITSSGITNWNTAYSNTHIHSNFNVLSGITFSDLLTQSNKDILSHLSIVDGRLQSDIDFYSLGEISAYNVGTGTTVGGSSTTLGGLVNVLDDVDDVLPYQYFLFKDSGATHWSKKLLSDLSVTWNNLAGKPTTLSGYGVSVSDTLFDTKYAPFNHSHNYLSSSGGSISGVISGTSIILSSGFTSVNAVFTSGLTTNKIFVSGLTNNFITKYSTTSGLTNSLIFDNGANVGIGNTNTTYKLDVSGTFRASGNSFFDSNVTISSGLTVNSESVLKGIRITNGIQSVTLTVDSNGRLKLDNASSGASFYATGEISAYGVSSGTTGSTGGGADYSRLDNWADYSVDKSGWVLSAKLGVDLNTRVSDLTNELNSLALNDLTDVDTTMSTQSTGEILVKEENIWKTKLYDFIRRPIMNVNGDVSETKEDYLLRVVGVYRYVGLSVVLKKDEIINDVLFTKNVRYEFVDGILDSDFKEVKAMELATSFDEIDDTKATSIALSKELYSLVMHIDGGNF